MIAWPIGVNKTIRAETSGAFGNGIIADTMRSGKKKTRLTSSSVPDSFSVSMVLNRTEFALFKTWYKTALRYGALSFQFPKIAGTGNAEYIILPSPSWAQFGADTVKITMSWEEA